jgi:hypothetical protein
MIATITSVTAAPIAPASIAPKKRFPDISPIEIGMKTSS